MGQSRQRGFNASGDGPSEGEALPISLVRPTVPADPHIVALTQSFLRICSSENIVFWGEQGCHAEVRIREAAKDAGASYKWIGVDECIPEPVEEGTLIVCQGVLDHNSSDPEALIPLLAEVASSKADAVIVSATDREVAGDGDSARWSYSEFRELPFSRYGASVLWGGFVYKEGLVGGARDTMILVLGKPDLVLGRHLSSAPRGLLCEPEVMNLGKVDLETAPTAKVCIATNNITGMNRNGVGTAHASLSTFLGSRGHDVTILYTGPRPEDSTDIERWTQYYRDRNVTFLPLPEYSLVDDPYSNHILASHHTYRWLKKHDKKKPFDVIHFTECQGHGFHSLYAKRLQLAFAKTTLVVTSHGSRRWAIEGDDRYLSEVREFMLDEIEFRSIELADIVIGPSAYKLDWLQQVGGAALPMRTAVQQYISPVDIEADSNSADHFSELVYFGRLDRRKGLHHFLNAIDDIHDELPEGFLITFLGEPAIWDGRILSTDFVAEYSEKWNCRCQVLDGLNQIEACDYVREAGRVSVIASVQDNLPNTVMECLALGVAFVASRVGGIQELIAPEDLSRVCFDIAQGEKDLVRLLRKILLNGYGERPRFAVKPEETARCIDLWHRAMALRAKTLKKDGIRRTAIATDRKSFCIVTVAQTVADAERVIKSFEDQSNHNFVAEIFVPESAQGEVIEYFERCRDNRLRANVFKDDLGRAIGDRLDKNDADAIIVLGSGISLRPDAIDQLAATPGEFISIGVQAASKEGIPFVPISESQLIQCFGNVSAFAFMVTSEGASRIRWDVGAADLKSLIDSYVIQAAFSGVRWGFHPELLGKGPCFRAFYEGPPPLPVPQAVEMLFSESEQSLQLMGHWVLGLGQTIEDLRNHCDRVESHMGGVKAHAEQVQNYAEGVRDHAERMEKYYGPYAVSMENTISHLNDVVDQLRRRPEIRCGDTIRGAIRRFRNRIISRNGTPSNPG